MIQKQYIVEWSNTVPWQNMKQVEQDLLLTRILINLYQHEDLRQMFAFRGGTALNKLFYTPLARYSEDIDLVHLQAEPIGQTLDRIREVLDPFLGIPKRDFSKNLITLTYKLTSDEGYPIKIKVEINTTESYPILGFKDYEFVCESQWSPGSITIRSYSLEELMGTKLRALYQRSKGRDLYDLYVILEGFPQLNLDAILLCFEEYTKYLNQRISRKIICHNLEAKLLEPKFRLDVEPLLGNKKIAYDPDFAYEYILQKLLVKLD